MTAPRASALALSSIDFLKSIWLNRLFCSMNGRSLAGGREVVVIDAGRKHCVRVGVVEGGEGDLLEVVHTLRPRGRLAHLLHGRQQQADQDRENGDHDQQLKQREAASYMSCAWVNLLWQVPF